VFLQQGAFGLSSRFPSVRKGLSTVYFEWGQPPREEKS